jgi:GMP synthase-like glutamine amidotransferase
VKVLSVVHSDVAGPELFGEVLAEDGHEHVVWDIRTQGAPPREADAVLVFGGDQNVGEEVQHPWLHEEYEALRAWVEDGTPLFGVCLGAQTLAHALGAEVRRADVELAGFYETELTDEGERDPVLGVLPRRFLAFNANGYTFAFPPGSTPLATGPVPQAYRAGERAWAVQFHPEILRENVLRWFEYDGAVASPDEVAAQLDEHGAEWREHGRRLLRAFLATAR